MENITDAISAIICVLCDDSLVISAEDRDSLLITIGLLQDVREDSSVSA